MWVRENLGALSVRLYLDPILRMVLRSLGRDFWRSQPFMVGWRKMSVIVGLFSLLGRFVCLMHARISSSTTSKAIGHSDEWLASFLSFMILIASFLAFMSRTFIPPFWWLSESSDVVTGGGESEFHR